MSASGLNALGDVRWGEHLCQFYRTKDDLADVLVPWFKAGLDANEHCVWLCADPLEAAAARALLQHRRLEIVGDEDVTIRDWLLREERALEQGCEGLRIGGNAFRLDDCGRALFTGRRILALCSYSLIDCGPDQIIEAIRAHRRALIKKDGVWRVLEGATSALAITGRDHAVRFYHQHEFPTDRVVEYLLHAINDNHAAVAFAEREHLVAIERALEASGSDVRALKAEGRLITGDASELAEELRCGGKARFQELIGARVTGAVERFSGIRAYGEIVNVLALAGRPDLSLELEGWWHELIERYPLELLCGYTISAFTGPDASELFDRVCHAHGRIEAASALETSIGKLDRLQHVTSALADATELAQIARVVISELASSLAAEQIVLAILGDDGRVHLYSEVEHRQIDRVATVSLDAPIPIVSVIRTGMAEDGCIPLSSAGRCVGAFGIFGRAEGAIQPADRALLEDYAKQIAMAVDRIGSHEDARLAKRRLQLLADIGRVMTEARLDSQMIAENAAGIVTRAGFADHCAIHLHMDENLLSLTKDAMTIDLPLHAGGEMLGTLIATRHHPTAPFSDEDRRLFEEIADRISLCLENALLYERAQRASRAKDEFLAMLGHELRNPLAPILTAVQLMRLRGNDVLTKERTIIERQVRHMVRLVDDLLDVSRIAKGKVHLKRAPVELAQVVANALEIASPILEDRAHIVAASVPSTGLVVDADAQRLAQVLSNLLTNAAKYTPAGGLIEVSAVVKDSKVALSVKDNGIGIDRELLPRVFDLFVQGQQSNDRARGGLGLGLAIAKNLVQLHGGDLYADSDGIGHGSTFTVELQLVELRPRLLPAPLPAREAKSGSARRVLVVDDNVDAARLLADVLACMGHEVRIAPDGPSALRVAADFRPEFALLDIGLPAMDGWELAGRLAAILEEAPPQLIAISGYGLETDRQKSLAHGFVAHLVKPIDLDRLETVLRSTPPVRLREETFSQVTTGT